MGTRIEVLLWANRICVRSGTAAPHELLEIKPDATLDDAQEAFHKVARLAHPDLHRGLDANELEKVTTAYATVANAYQAFRSAKLRGPTPAPGPIAAGPRAEPTRAKRPTDQPQAVRLPGGGVIRSGSATTPPKFGGAQRPTGASPPLPRPSGGTQPPPVSGAPTGPGAPLTPPHGAATAKPPSGPIGKPASPSQPLPKPGATPPHGSSAPEGEDFASDTGTSPVAAMSSKALVHYRKAEMSLRRGDLRGAVLSLKMAVAADPQSTFLRQALSKVETELKG